MNRREWMAMGASALAARQAAAQASPQSADAVPKDGVLPLEQFQPKSMLHVPETHVPRSRYPVIDFHTHITSGRGNPPAIHLSMDPANCLAVMDRKNIRTMVSLTGSYGDALR